MSVRASTYTTGGKVSPPQRRLAQSHQSMLEKGSAHVVSERAKAKMDNLRLITQSSDVTLVG